MNQNLIPPGTFLISIIQGIKGQGVRVAVLDGGTDVDHPDLAPNLNLDASKSFVPGEGIQYALPNIFSHGAHVEGIIGAADNGVGVIGIAPEVELVHVKVLSDILRYGLFSWIMQGIYYAADEGVDIINMSFGFLVEKQTGLDNSLLVRLKAARCRAIDYA